MSRLRWNDDALADLGRIAVYIDQFDSAAARRVVTAIVQATIRLEDFPLSGSRTGTGGVRKLSVPRWNYVVYYGQGDEVTILRVVHARRRRQR